MPSITIWNRVEPRARTEDMKAGLEARVHDPLWLLARQWQVGEFAGRDAGSPVRVDVQSTTAAFDRCAAGAEAARPYDNRMPLEALVECGVVRPAHAAQDLRQAAEAGQYFFRLLDAANLTRLRSVYLRQYPLPTPSAHDSDALRLAAIVSGRAVDGVKLYADLVQAGNTLPTAPQLSTADRTLVLGIAKTWRAWYESLFTQPANADSWTPDRMEYSFAVGSAGSSSACVAREYDGGIIDWYTFDRRATPLTGGTAQPITAARSVMATPVTFRGMPARRFWEMEDASVDIGTLSAAAQDIGRLLLREFAMIYGNDWLQIPLAVPAGSEVTINSLKVADSFGLVTTIPHYSEVDGSGGGWRLFGLATDTASAAPASARVLVIPPNAVSALDGPPIEDVLLLRDELADMVWGVERTAVGSSGLPVDRPLAWKTSAPPQAPPVAGALPKYRLGSTVPDYWIPFLPVTAGNGPLRMRRGKMPTALGGPMGRMLAYPGLTIFLEELPREGVHLERRFRSARGPDGSTYVWIGRRRSTGRGEGRSGLRFDYIE